MCKIEDQIKVVDFVKLIWRLKLWKKIKKTKIVNKELMRDENYNLTKIVIRLII